MVSLTYAGADPGTMVIMHRYTAITHRAMKNPWRPNYITSRTQLACDLNIIHLLFR